MSAPSSEIMFSKDEIEKIVRYIPYKKRVEMNTSASDSEVWQIGSETMPRLGVVSEILDYEINVSQKMKQCKGIPENIKLEDVLK